MNAKKKVGVKTCKWCYQVYLIGDISKHYQCMKIKKQFNQRRKRSLNYDKTGGKTNDRTVTNI